MLRFIHPALMLSICLIAAACGPHQRSAASHPDSLLTIHQPLPTHPIRSFADSQPSLPQKPDTSPAAKPDTGKHHPDTTQHAIANRRVWPVKFPPTLPGSIFPEHRVVAFYGNLYSKKMGILGELPPDQMVAKLLQMAHMWQQADTTKKVIPALHLIAVTAQGYPGKDGKHRLRMPNWMIDSVMHMASRINGLVFLDVQVGLSTLQDEVPRLEPYLKLPNVHLAIDPEFSMKTGAAPGTRIGTFDAADVNYCADFLTRLVQQYHLPPKILVVHRFTQRMLTNYKDIKLRPEVQIVMDMDGWGPKSLKIDSYKNFIAREPVEYTGFKLFFKNDTRNGQPLMTPQEVLSLFPPPVYIQYQ
ncbi:MAG: hypothetical protein K6T34_06800 [Thermoflavifilum sp.]|nr:hypothetical protein [Thermoflavifilum sp.]